MAIRALVFDFDGSILDTESPALRAWQELYEEHGAVLPLDLWCQLVGTAERIVDVHAHLEGLVGYTLEREAIRLRCRARSLDLIALEQPRPGVVRWIDEALERGLVLAVASSSSRDWVDEHLRHLGLRERFRCIRGREDVARTKPAPDLFLAAVEALGVAPAEAIAIEDSPNGVAAAKAAGLYCVAVPNAVTRPLLFDHADLVVESLEYLSLAQLLAEVEALG